MGPTGGWPAAPSQFDSGPASPGNWSTVATPGTADHRAFDLPVSPPSNDPRRATVSGELEGHPPSSEASLFGDHHIGRPTEISPEPAPPHLRLQLPEPRPILPSEVVPSHTEIYTTPSIETTVHTTSQPHHQNFQLTPPPPIPTQQPPARVFSSPPTVPAPPPQLTPKQIAQAQKHCRYAISALDYEDFERAKKDLLDALKIIGG